MDIKAKEYIPNDCKDEDCFDTINKRQPAILIQAADYFINNYKDYLKSKKLNNDQLKEAENDARKVYDEIMNFSKKPPKNENLTRLDDDNDDVKLWNLQFDEYVEKHQKQPNYLDTSILWTECYMYRSLISIFLNSKYFKDFDAFRKIKKDGLISNRIAATKLIEHTANISKRLEENKSTCEEEFQNFLSFALWGNRFDLSCNYGHENTDNWMVDDLKKLKSKIVSDSTKKIYEYFKSFENRVRKITIILDNAGFELLGDLCFIEMLYQTGLLDENSQIIFHDKMLPWFVSDVVDYDFHWLLNYLSNNFESPVANQISQRWSKFLTNGQWQLRSHLYWTTCFSFCEMKRLAPDLYDELSESSLLIFCGDLNNRKLISDFLWDINTPFQVALRGFWPTNIVSIRTIKCRPVVDVDKHVKLPEHYWINGDHAVIHFYKKQ